MANCLFAFPNFADSGPIYTPEYSGGSWSANLPLTNLSDRRLALVARTTDTELSSTQFDVDLGIVRGVRVFAIPKHRISIDGLYRIRGSNTEGDFSAPVYDTGWQDVYPVIYPLGSLPFGHPSFWTGKLSVEDSLGYNIGLVHVAPTLQIARYWRFEIDDTTNPDGWVDLARLFISPGYQPSINMSYGAKLGLDTATVRSETDGGATVFNEKARRRSAIFTLDNLPHDEAFVNVFDMKRRLGTSGQLFFIFDTDDTAHMHRRSFLCVHQELSALEFPYFGRNSAPISLVEEL